MGNDNMRTGIAKFSDGLVVREAVAESGGFFDASKVKKLAKECAKHREASVIRFLSCNGYESIVSVPIANTWNCLECLVHDQCPGMKRNEWYRGE